MIAIAESLLREIRALQHKKTRLLIAVDGRCAAGKSTLAELLQKTLSCGVIHMDHFFLRPCQRTDERLREPGGNVDRERFAGEVLAPLARGLDFSYRPYDCRRMDFGAPIAVPAHAICIVEGAYSCHPELRDRYDLRVFLSVEPEEQLERIRRRNGDARVAEFQQKWIPLEERYFALCRVREHCDLLYTT